MDANQLSQNVTEARDAEFGPDQTTEQFPSKYFDYGVFVTAPNGATTPRAPRYCATDRGAAELSNVLSSCGRQYMACQIYKSPAMNMEGGWVDNKNVPWCRFALVTDDQKNGPYTGPTINTGLLLDYFNHGFPANRALNSCQLEILDAYAAAGLIPADSYDRNAIMVQPL